MKYLLATSLFAFFAVGILRGAEILTPDIIDRLDNAKYVSIDKNSTGERTLVVKYPWRTHEKASIEALLIPEKKDFAARTKPLRFDARRVDEVTLRHLLTTFDNAVAKPTTWKADIGGLKWEILGSSNHLGREALWVVNLPENNPNPGTTAVFFPLHPWSINDKMLVLDLPRQWFDKPGKMIIWFLRGDTEIWQEEVMWPGKS